jgi:hypothetical protein
MLLFLRSHNVQNPVTVKNKAPKFHRVLTEGNGVHTFATKQGTTPELSLLTEMPPPHPSVADRKSQRETDKGQGPTSPPYRG